MEINRLVFSVSECLALINQTLEYAYPSVTVEGEISSFKVNKGKFVFFDLKDSEALLSCFMMVYQLCMPLEDGMKVQVYAQPRLTAGGKFSLTVREITLVGEGTLKRSFELLKSKLDKEGLFAPERKRSLPFAPERIGLIASVESAGYSDFIKILNNRWPGTSVSVANVQVQGIAASQQIIRALNYFNQQAEPVEALVLIRGGGSNEDLSVFNEELLVREVAASRIPTVVGVGHEVDISLCDMAADVRAATPSNAAELLVPECDVILRQIAREQQVCTLRLTSRLETTKSGVDNQIQQCVDMLESSLANYRQHVSQYSTLLRQLDPKVVLKRGYALVRDNKNHLLRANAKDLKPGDMINVTLESATIEAEVKYVQAV